MPSQNVYRRLISLPWRDNSSLQSIDIPRNMDLKALMIRVVGECSTTVGVATAARTWQTEILRRIQLVAGGSVSLADMAFTDLVYGNYQRRFQVNATRVTDLAIANNKPFEFVGILDLQNYDGIRPTDSSLHTKPLSLLQLLITTGSGSDILNLNTAIDTADTSVEVYLMESIEDEAGYNEPRWVRKISQQRVTVTAANTALQVQLARGNLLRAIRVRGVVDVEPMTATNMLQNATFRSGVDVRYNMTYAAGRFQNQVDYGRVSTDQNGILIIDLANDNPSQMSKLFNLAGVTEATLELNTLAPGAAREYVVTIDEFIAPPAQG